MELEFEKADLLQLDPISCRGTLKLLPPGKKKKQKLVVGDDSGTLCCYEFKKGEPVVVFSSNFFGGPVSGLTISGIQNPKDKIFACHGQNIIGVTKKGKEFFKLTSSLTESINHIFVEESNIWTSCEYIYNAYENGADVGFYMCHDQIHSMTMEHVSKQSEYSAILGCQDSAIRIINGSSLTYEIATPGPVMALCACHESGAILRPGAATLLYGTGSGTVTRINTDGSSCVNLWSIYDDHKATVTDIASSDITQDGYSEIVVAKDDGRLEVFSIDDATGEPVRSFARDIGESIRSVEIGKVNSASHNEIVIAAYSGRITSFTSEPTKQRAPDDTYGRSVQTVNDENRIRHLKKELEVLKGKVTKEKDKLKTLQQKVGHGSFAAASDNARSVFVDFPINSKFVLNEDESAYGLSVEIQSPIDIVVLRSPVHLDLVDSGTLGNAVVSVTPQTVTSPAEEDGTDFHFVATYRCQSQERRLNLFIRTTEGEYGDLLVTVVTGQTPKSAKIIRHPMKPLSLHARVHMLSEEEMARPRNVIRFSGAVSLSLLHDWVLALVPDIPSRIDEESTGECFFFRNVYSGAVGLCSLKKNELVFESQNPSTIAIVKEHILRYATARRLEIDDRTTCSNESVPSFLALIHDRLAHQLSLSRKMGLIEAIQEMTMQETDLRWLSAEYAAILKDQETIRKEFASREKTLERLCGIITDLFVDWHKLHGRDCRSQIPMLQNHIMSGNLDDIADVILKY